LPKLQLPECMSMTIHSLTICALSRGLATIGAELFSPVSAWIRTGM